MKDNKIVQFLIAMGVAFAQLVMSQIVTFIFSFGFGDVSNVTILPTGAVLAMGITMPAGIILAGWLAIKLGWLKSESRLPARIACTLIGAYIPLVVGLVSGGVAPGDPVFAVSIVLALIGFYLPDWIKRK